MGRRNTFLVAFGLIWIVYAWSLTQGPFVTGSAQRLFARMGPFRDSLATPWWAALWAATGFVAITIAARESVMRGRRPNRHCDASGFNSLLVAPLLWVLLHGWSWIISLFAHGEGNRHGWVSAVVWGAAVVAILVVAGWPEVDPPREDR